MNNRQRMRVTKRKPCPFCTSNTEAYFVDVATLERFLTDRGKIVPRKRSGVCSKHQARLARAVKQARYLALLPFIEQVV